MKLVNLARSKAEVKEQNTLCKSDAPSFSYGTSIRFDKDDLEKMGLKLGDLKPGTVFSIEATAEVVSVSQNKSSNYDSASLELQITEIGLEEQEDDIGDAISSAIDKANEENS